MDRIEGLLVEWGSWAGGFSRGGGYSNPMWNHLSKTSKGADFSEIPPHLEQIEKAVAHLRRHHPFLKKLIFQRYLYNLHPEEIATTCGQTKLFVQAGLDRARDWIGDWLDAQEAISKNLGKLAISNR